MSTQIAQDFRAEIRALQTALLDLSPQLAGIPWRVGGWNRRETVGHLLDSATNNRQRFVRASTDGEYSGPQYLQEVWVAAHGYSEQSWETLVQWWIVEHEILAAVVDRIPEERLAVSCVVGDDEPVTLRFLIEDYIAHQRWHFAQLTAPAPEH
jgi:hypothetical protein